MKDFDFVRMRNKMVEEQLIPRGISDNSVLEAFRKVPRHKFIPQEFWESAYNDYPLPIGEGQTISQPYMVALMTELIHPHSADRVLEIGTGSGYQMAILAELVKEVYSVERFRSLAEKSEDALRSLGYKNCRIKVGDGTLGWEEYAPYDGIIVTAGSPALPPSLVRQVKDDGRLVIPVGSGFGQILTVLERSGESARTSEVCGCVFVPLVGEEGWPDSKRGL